jgi:hypothetical protein
MSQNATTGCVFIRVPGRKRSGKKKSFDFKRQPAVKIPAADGTVLLRPQPAVVLSPAPARVFAIRDDGSAQSSQLFVGMRKHACIGDERLAAGFDTL